LASKPSPPIPDGFERNFIDPREAICRVTAKYGEQQPPWTPIGQTDFLQTALGAIVLDEHSVRQLYLALAYDFKERLACGDTVPQTNWILASICAHAIRNSIAIPTPNCFTLMEEFSFRA
jgi:hypothetical protein